MLASSTTPVLAQDPELVDYVTVPGDTCVRIAQRVWGDRRRTDVLHQYNPQLGPPNHRLAVGTHLRLPRVAPPVGSGPDAQVTEVQRQVEARPPEREAWDRATLGLDLYRGWRVSTHARSMAELTFRDTSVVELREETLIVVFGASEGALRRGGTVATLDRGTLRSRLGELAGGGRMSVESAGASAQLTGGSALVTIEGDGTARVANHEGGSALLTSNDVRGASVRVPAGMGSQVRRGERPTRPRPLPAAPAWTTGEAVRFLATAGEGGTVRASWEAVSGAALYRVEIARRPDGRDIVFATEVPATITRLEAQRIPAGTYHVRIATIDHEHFEGRPGTARVIDLALAQLERPGASSVPASGAIDAAIDSDASELDAAPRPLMIVPGTRVTMPAGIRCALGDGTLAGDIVFGASMLGAMRCEGEDGAPVGGLDVELVTVAVTVAGAEANGAVSLTRGEERELALDVDGDDLPIALAAGPGVRVIEHVIDGRAHRVRVAIALDAPESSALSVAVGGTGAVLASIPLTIADAPRDEAPPVVIAEPAPVPAPVVRLAPPPLPEGIARIASPYASAVRDDRQRGIALDLGAAVLVPSDGGEPQLRTAAHVGVGLFDDVLRIDVGAVLDAGEISPIAHAGSGDMTAQVMGVVHRDDDVQVSLEMGAWIPTQPGQEGLGRVRLMPAINLSFRADERLFVRVRQGAIVDLADDGDVLWASSYALDWWAHELFVIGLEADVAWGERDERTFVPIAAALNGSVVLGPIALGVTARAGLTNDAQQVWGPFSALLHVRGTISP